jgi:hypothetical protein
MVVAISRRRAQMQLKELSLFVPTIEAGTILKALETGTPASAIEQALKETKASEKGISPHSRVKYSNSYILPYTWYGLPPKFSSQFIKCNSFYLLQRNRFYGSTELAMQNRIAKP